MHATKSRLSEISCYTDHRTRTISANSGESIKKGLSLFSAGRSVMKKYSTLRFMSIILSASLLTGIPAATVFAASAAPTETAVVSTAPAAQENKSDTELYLDEYFHIPAVTSGDAAGFNNDLKVILGSTDAPQVEGALTWKSVLPVLAKAADFNEFALTYPSSKIDARLTKYGISKVTDADFGRYLAADLDAGLITPVMK